MEFTHLDENNRPKMVEVSHKEETLRCAVAVGFIKMKESTIELIGNTKMKKGDVISTAQIAGIMGAKKTSDIIPMCHPLMLTGVSMDFNIVENGIQIKATVKTVGKTGVEMEALTAVSIAALTIYDMCKSADKEMIIEKISLLEKTGGKSWGGNQ